MPWHFSGKPQSGDHSSAPTIGCWPAKCVVGAHLLAKLLPLEGRVSDPLSWQTGAFSWVASLRSFRVTSICLRLIYVPASFHSSRVTTICLSLVSFPLVLKRISNVNRSRGRVLTEVNPVVTKDKSVENWMTAGVSERPTSPDPWVNPRGGRGAWDETVETFGVWAILVRNQKFGPCLAKPRT